MALDNRSVEQSDLVLLIEGWLQSISYLSLRMRLEPVAPGHETVIRSHACWSDCMRSRLWLTAYNLSAIAMWRRLAISIDASMVFHDAIAAGDEIELHDSNFIAA